MTPLQADTEKTLTVARGLQKALEAVPEAADGREGRRAAERSDLSEMEYAHRPREFPGRS